ncbi:MAG TPA: hypothetical protein PLL83_13960, partial [Rhodoferax sp.]|nr:hypothetical protein [Rhodoferax sp.]
MASPGHFDELRGKLATNLIANSEDYTGAWTEFLAQAEARTPADLDQHAASLQRQIHDNGVTYNVYSDEEGP